MKWTTSWFRRVPSDRELLKSHLIEHTSVWEVVFPEEHRWQWVYGLALGLCVCVMTGFALYHIQLHGQATKLNYRLNDAQTLLQTLQTEQQHLRRTHAALLAPKYLVPLATEQLGLKPTQRKHIFRLPSLLSKRAQQQQPIQLADRAKPHPACHP